MLTLHGLPLKEQLSQVTAASYAPCTYTHGMTCQQMQDSVIQALPASDALQAGTGDLSQDTPSAGWGNSWIPYVYRCPQKCAEACGGGAGWPPVRTCTLGMAQISMLVQKWRQQRVDKQYGLRRPGNSSWGPSEPVLGPRLIYLSWQPLTGTCTIRKHPVRQPNWKQSAALRQQSCSGKL